MNTCAATHRKIVRSWGTATEFGHKACGAPATKVRQVKQAHGDYTWPVYSCDEHARPTDEDIATEEPAAEVVEEPAPVEHRETTIRVSGVERIIRTEVGGKIRTVKQLEAAHTKAVKAAIIEMRIAGAPDSMPHDMAEAQAKRVTQLPKCNWDAAVRPLRPVPTVDPTTYLVEVAPNHYATEDAAEGLFDLPEATEPAPTPIVRLDGESFLDALLKNVA